MNLEEIQALADKDLKLDDTELDIESLKTPELHNKYLKLLSKFNLLLKRLIVIMQYYTKTSGNITQVKPILKSIWKNHLT